jgi:hypothetical protein
MFSRLALEVVLVVAPMFAAHAEDAAVVLVVDRVGEVAVAGTDAPRPVTTLAVLPVGTRMRLEPASRITLLYVASGDEYIVAGAGEARVDAIGVSTTNGASAQRRPASSNAKPVQLRSDAIAMGGVVMRSGGLRTRHPAGVLTAPPGRMTWESPAVNSRYRVELYNAGGTVLFSQTAQGLSLPFPDSVALHADERYTWSVSLDGGAAPAPVASASFTLASGELRDKARHLSPDAGAAFSDRLVYGLWLEQVGALGEARQLWQQLAEERPYDEALLARARR